MPGIKIFLNKKNSKQMEKLTEKYLNSRLALVSDGKVLHTPKVRSVIKTDKFDMTFCNKGNFELVLKNLEKH